MRGKWVVDLLPEKKVRRVIEVFRGQCFNHLRLYNNNNIYFSLAHMSLRLKALNNKRI